MPDIIGLRWLPRRNIRDYPLYVCTSRAKSSLRCCKCLFRKIENGDGFKTLIKKCIDQPRYAPADIDDRRGSVHASCPNKIEGNVGFLLKPTDDVFVLGRVNIFPVCLATAHSSY